MTFDQDCECGNENCSDTVMFRKGPMWYDGHIVYNFLHIDAFDIATGKSVEVILTKKTARQFLWWMIKNFWRP